MSYDLSILAASVSVDVVVGTLSFLELGLKVLVAQPPIVFALSDDNRPEYCPCLLTFSPKLLFQRPSYSAL